MGRGAVVLPVSRRVCTEPGCGAIIDKPGRCPEHRRDHEQRRGSRQDRGYDAAHDQLRAQWAPIVATGHVRCWRCRGPLDPAAWHLGHDDHDRTRYRGPECVPCSTATATRNAQGMTNNGWGMSPMSVSIEDRG